jgi:hypothetical protein
VALFLISVRPDLSNNLEGGYFEQIRSAEVYICKKIIRDATKLAVDRGYHNVHIESDAQEVVKLWNDPGAGRSDIASTCREIRELSDISFTSFQISFVSRLANQASHSIASQVCSVRRRCLWLNYTPQFLATTLEIDCNNSE